jgi:hypothetical protein
MIVRTFRRTIVVGVGLLQKVCLAGVDHRFVPVISDKRFQRVPIVPRHELPPFDFVVKPAPGNYLVSAHPRSAWQQVSIWVNP